MDEDKDLNISATRLQVVGLNFPEELKVDREKHFQPAILDVVVAHLYSDRFQVNN